MSTAAREFHLRRHPDGEPVPDDFELVARELPDPADGELLVRNSWLSVDPYMRGRMSGIRTYIDPYALGAPMDGAAVGEVIASSADGFAVGDTVVHQAGWRDHALLGARHVQKLDTSVIPPQAFLGVLGMPGLTAYAGLVEVAPVRDGDVVLISAAAGAVGSMAVQVARLLGASRVIGVAGGPQKCAYVTDELGADDALDYKQPDLAKRLRAIAPDGIDVYFDNVGGETLEAAIGSLRVWGRIAICGMISQYNATTPPAGPRNLARLIQTRGQMRGFLVLDQGHLRARFVEQVGGWLTRGALRYRETATYGLESAPQAFIDLLHGANTGKMLVKLD
ncbi:NADP-dependent oxidoreductase [Conexibacter sp. JD483]|nr:MULTISPECIES: NADP-dependent oxidoreductase [unclassified Conexibacter]MDO8188877.1 NADP-dependent oxidoreductase [Conexibacter sp. CPCC 205706]MDO8201667.1 NADP-dependent oxidoreductase [Conexibacter sp. CPCC 205762]MDR9372913.1 NADP-dependent oxidoreductase [Conexibacter sp. JD483]